MNDVSKELPRTESLSPLSTGDLRIFLKSSFERKETDVGQHSVLDTQWESVLNEFKATSNRDKLLGRIYQRSKIDILDEGCGSSITIFEAVESAEESKKVVSGFGITASLGFLNMGVDPALREEFLGMVKPEGVQRSRLLLEGVKYREGHGHYRFTQNGGVIKITKKDLHLLSEAFPGQKFDLIYSSATYSHLTLPWLVFAESCNALKKGGLLLIDAIPTESVVDYNGNKISVKEFTEYFQKTNPKYKLQFTPFSENSFYLQVIVEKLGEENLQSNLYLGAITNQFGIKKPVTVFSKHTLKEYSPITALK